MSDDFVVNSPKLFYEIPDISIGEFVAKSLARLEPQIKLILNSLDGTELTVKELVEKCHSIGRALIARGITKADTILTYAENSTELAIVMFVAIYLGVTLYPITPIARVYELSQLLDTLGPLFIFTSEAKSKVMDDILSKRQDKQQKARFVAVLNGTHSGYVPFELLLSEGAGQTLAKVPHFVCKPKKDICLMMQSSGTSGVPKSVMVSHTAFVAALMSFIKLDLPAGKQPVNYTMTQFSCMSGLNILFGYAICGVSQVLTDETNDQLVLKAIQDNKINFMGIVPAFGHKLLNDQLVGGYDLSSLMILFITGAAFPENVAKNIIRKYKVLFLEVYGMTEYAGALTVPDMTRNEYIAGCLGRPGDNTQMKIIDTDGQSLGPNMTGEICVRGPKLFSGYLNNVLATNEAIDKDGWFHTGDIGHYDNSHRFYITDRLKELIKFGAKQVSPVELEQFLLEHPSVAEVVVVGVPHRYQTQWPRAYVRLRDQILATEKQLQQFVLDTLSDSKQLRAGVVFVDHIQRTTVGKVDRRYYKQLVANELIED